jgi:hypothetical protein
MENVYSWFKLLDFLDNNVVDVDSEQISSELHKNPQVPSLFRPLTQISASGITMTPV